jgi:hypothetical protein
MMAYDDASRTVLLLGAADSRGTEYGDPLSPPPADSRAMWIWDGAQWTRIRPAHLPTGRLLGLAYDRVGGYMVAVTDTDTVSFPLLVACFDHNWHWSGGDWAEASQVAAPLEALTTEPGTGHVLALQGSFTGTVYHGSVACHGNAAKPRPAATVRWTGRTWERAGAGFSLTEGSFFVADRLRRQVLSYGDDHPEVTPTDRPGGPRNFAWDGRYWTPLNAPTQVDVVGCAQRLQDLTVVDAPTLGGPLIVAGSRLDFRAFRDVVGWNGRTWAVTPPRPLPCYATTTPS